MAAKDSNDKSKTSKTARVMNLLSKKHDSDPPPEEVQPAEAASEGNAAPATSSTPPTPPILTSLSAEAAVSGQIKNALEEALADELPPAPAPARQEAPVPEPAPTPQPDAPAPAPAPMPAPAAEVQPQQAPIPDDQSLGYINVMQVLVHEKATKYMQMFGLCTCRRCVQDVEALALNHLPPKYVVMADHEMIPKLTFYEGKYSSDITAQLLQACKKIMATPHHDR